MKSNLKRHWEEKRDQNSLIKSFVLLEQKFLISIFFKLSFEAITGDSWESDIALDDIWWKVGKCGKFKLTLRVHGIETFFKLYNWNPNPRLLTFFYQYPPKISFHILNTMHAYMYVLFYTFERAIALMKLCSLRIWSNEDEY